MSTVMSSQYSVAYMAIISKLGAQCYKFSLSSVFILHNIIAVKLVFTHINFMESPVNMEGCGYIQNTIVHSAYLTFE